MTSAIISYINLGGWCGLRPGGWTRWVTVGAGESSGNRHCLSRRLFPPLPPLLFPIIRGLCSGLAPTLPLPRRHRGGLENSTAAHIRGIKSRFFFSDTNAKMDSQAPPHGSFYLSPDAAKRLDEELMGPEIGFSVDQLMELAGLSVAQVVHFLYAQSGGGGEAHGGGGGAGGEGGGRGESCEPFEEVEASQRQEKELAAEQKKMKILVCCGPGNNGGDGLVAARHLKQFGHDVTVCYPIVPKRELFKNLLRQLDAHQVAVVDDVEKVRDDFEVVIDALFGFGFASGQVVRAPFDGLLRLMTDAQGRGKTKIVSVDVPSGWHVERGPASACGHLLPHCLVSLTAPKKCAAKFEGPHHFLAGRFLTPKLIDRYELQSLPRFPG
eukprot:GHVT01031825.1.p1 GENE.GHVT01031825.1~~GHVT01031825.1.p1  ORF type:complete len:381 (-),score=67.45 GHVT01031825.1:220-1362(-)